MTSARMREVRRGSPFRVGKKRRARPRLLLNVSPCARADVAGSRQRADQSRSRGRSQRCRDSEEHRGQHRRFVASAAAQAQQHRQTGPPRLSRASRRYPPYPPGQIVALWRRRSALPRRRRRRLDARRPRSIAGRRHPHPVCVAADPPPFSSPFSSSLAAASSAIGAVACSTLSPPISVHVRRADSACRDGGARSVIVRRAKSAPPANSVL